jgi:hypothetical protein
LAAVTARVIDGLVLLQELDRPVDAAGHDFSSDARP